MNVEERNTPTPEKTPNASGATDQPTVQPLQDVAEQSVRIENISAEEAKSDVTSAAGNFINTIDQTFERAAEAVREQAGEAAEALRSGEFVQNAALDPNANSDDRLVGLLCYAVPVLMPLLVLFSESSQKRPFQRYHAVQSLGLDIAFAVITVAVSIGTLILQVIPIIGWLIGLVVFCLSPIAFMMAVVALLYYGYQAYQGKRFAIPGLTGFLRDQRWL